MSQKKLKSPPDQKDRCLEELCEFLSRWRAELNNGDFIGVCRCAYLTALHMSLTGESIETTLEVIRHEALILEERFGEMAGLLFPDKEKMA
jgi:hypothetical protein